MAKLPTGWLEDHKDGLLEFIYASFQHRYYNGDVEKDDTPVGGEPSFAWQKHDWRYQDWFWGGEPFSGIIVISWRESPARDWIECWTMTVHGSLVPNLTEEQISKTYQCLDGALKDAPKNRPYRGPGVHECDGYVYSSGLDTKATINKLSGTEHIKNIKDGILFRCHYEAQVINTLY